MQACVDYTIDDYTITKLFWFGTLHMCTTLICISNNIQSEIV